MNQLSDIAPAVAVLSDRDLVLNFESLGDNCEFGLVQRLAGAEPLGLFRFSGTPLRHLLRGMNARFEGMSDPDHVRIQAENGEYMVKLAKYDYIYHADVKVGDEDPEVLHRQHTRNVRFLAEEFVADLESPEKIFVFRQNEPLSANDLVDLRSALSRFGPSTLLWVTQACPGHPPGTVDVIDRSLMVGYVKSLAARDNVPNLDAETWMTVLRRAWMLWPDRRSGTSEPAIAPQPPSAPQGRVDVAFGADGNSEPSTGFGWSKPENGFTWSIEDRSLLTIDAPPAASDYWLEMDVIPYMAPPSVPRQTLTVSVNGTAIHRFEPLERGMIGCSVPGALVHGRDTVEILLEHPCAASPRDVAGENDERRLAIAFRTVSLVCAQMEQ
jgi:hypothetical protein